MREQRRHGSLEPRPRHARREHRKRMAQVDHRIKAASKEIVGHVGALQLPGFKSDRYSFWEFAAHPTSANSSQGLVQLRFACPTIEMERQRAEFSFEALDDLLATQRLDRFHAHDRGDHLVAQRTRPAAFMADLDQQPDHALFAPRMGRVLDRLSAHTEFRADGNRTQLSGRKHQQSDRPRAHVLVRVIDRQLLQSLLLDLSHDNDALHVALRRMGFSEFMH
ncbi:hypothetical protein [Burkholderia ubonensis]|uniref:hypothetical protein n=2 Tax=Burkholderia ubonensis TaxID=101571 RepID=UPI0018E01835|nr:hypothetical protein [Burkholderia ubonensis]